MEQNPNLILTKQMWEAQIRCSWLIMAKISSERWASHVPAHGGEGISECDPWGSDATEACSWGGLPGVAGGLFFGGLSTISMRCSCSACITLEICLSVNPIDAQKMGLVGPSSMLKTGRSWRGASTVMFMGAK
jgi:hypothetical protein